MNRNNVRILEGLAIGLGLLAGAAVLLCLVSCRADTKGVELSPKLQLSPDLDVSPTLSVTTEAKVSADTRTSGEARSGDVHAPGAGPVTQTTIGTIALGSGWLWAPVGLLVAVVARWQRKAVDRMVWVLEHGDRLVPAKHGDSQDTFQHLCRGLRQRVKHEGHAYGKPDAAERCINRSVKRLKRK